MYQEMYDKNVDLQEEQGREVAIMCQKMYDQNGTEAQIANALAT